MNKKNRIQALALVMAVGGLAAWAVTPSAAQPSRAEVSRFELTMRILEGVREKAVEAPKPVTSSFLRFTNLVNVDVEADLQAEQQIKKVYSLKDVSLLT